MATTHASSPSIGVRLAATAPLYLGAPLAALLAGMAAQWLDFQALRAPLLALVGCGVLATAIALTRGRRGWAVFGGAVALGFATWAGAQVVYSIIHVASGERFDAERFGAGQWSQGIGLILAHGVFLGLPTGAVAGLLLHTPVLRRFRAAG